ncbi:MAG: DNA polymerase/3'-5' exonuclease PolX [Thermogutta sp.]
MTNVEIAAVFEQIADLLEFQGANPFRVRAYRTAARTITELTEPIAEYVRNKGKDLTELSGIGSDLADKIATLVNTGTLPLLEELKAQVPESVLTLLRVPGLGPKRAAALYKNLQVATLEDLRQACLSHRVRELEGFGVKTEENILKGIEAAIQVSQRILWYEADQIVQSLQEHLQDTAGLRRLEPAGSYRRGKDTVGDLDLLALADDPTLVMDRLAGFRGVKSILARGDTKMSIVLQNGVQVDLRVVPAESFGAALQYFTGSKEHNVILRGMAKDRGLKVNEYGVFRGEERLAGAEEADVYATLGLPWFPPELREGRKEFEWAAEGKLPELVTFEDIRGDLHMHSTWSDGMATIEEMAEAARRLGYQYIAITDHSQRVAVANGLNAERVLAQWQAIDRISRNWRNFHILKGIEVDILEAGGLDLPDDILKEADWVVASVHFGQNQPREQITRRMIDAIKNPYVCAIAHPTGRLLLERPAYEVDLDAVFRAARDYGKMMELNAHPRRLDLDDVACAAAKAHGIPIVISTDAHSVNGLDAMRYGILQARRGGLTKADVVNTRPWRELKKLLPKYRK